MKMYQSWFKHKVCDQHHAALGSCTYK